MNGTIDSNYSGGQGFEELFEKVRALERRLEKLEAESGTTGAGEAVYGETVRVSNLQDRTTADDFITIDNSAIESKVVEYGLAWMGSLVLICGIAFLMIFVQNQWNPLLSTLLGLAASAGVFFLSNYLKSSFRHMSFLLNISAHLLVFYTLMRTFFFSGPPLIANEPVVLVLMLGAIYALLYRAVNRKSEAEATTGIVLLLFTALISDVPYYTFGLIILTSVTAFYLFYREAWTKLLVISMILAYVSHMLWFFGNPLSGHPFAIVKEHHFNYLYLFVYGTTFSLTQLVPHKNRFKEGIYTTTIVLTGILFSLVMMMNVVTFFETNYVILFGIIFIACFAYSIILKLKVDRLFDPSFFACFSYMALSAALYGLVKLPDAYYLLALQSLLVLSMALWYRSRIIVIMNTLMFTGITVIYLVYSQPVNKVNFTLAFTALISARFINWKKERMDLKSETVRNTYLSIAFFTVLYALYKAFPHQYVTLSWTCAAVIYFILSVLIKNIKYRYMAILTLVVTAFYLFLVDLRNMEVGYRVLAFLFLAVISIGASLYYTKKIRKKNKSPLNTGDNLS